MGGIKSKQKAQLKKKELQGLIKVTHFTQKEIQKLFENFRAISSSNIDDGVIDQAEFQQALGLKDSMFAGRLFRIFDDNDDKGINFREFVTGFSVLCPKGTLDEKLRFSFRLYDIDGDGFIDKEELYNMLKASLFENFVLELSEGQMRALVDQTFAEVDVNGDGKISFDEYRLICESMNY
eukprot:TRINITY_DN3873_c0_g1_i1.p1 TRINITY_DN3873_c0_g1~~TRINITY_DN3873_c0_g1_i1.p1  ORF type:complete len:180 (+),score=41.93 TRINITY_DN3873_c0_g1_i1:197-736(+)